MPSAEAPARFAANPVSLAAAFYGKFSMFENHPVSMESLTGRGLAALILAEFCGTRLSWGANLSPDNKVGPLNTVRRLR
jgi:hypothetical protein